MRQRRCLTDLWWFFILGVAVVLPACGDQGGPGGDWRGSDGGSRGAETSIIIPDMPFWDNSVLEIDPLLIQDHGSEYCAGGREAPSSADFLLGYLALRSSDDLCQLPPDKEVLGKVLGSLYLSGFFGGVWLRDALHPRDADPEGLARTLMSAVVAAPPEEIPEGESQPVFRIIANVAGSLIDTGLEGRSVFAANFMSLYPFLMIYGYNLGYLEYILANPPLGVVAPENVFECREFLDCEQPGTSLATLEKYKPVLDNLYNRETLADQGASSFRWLQLNGAIEDWGRSSKVLGESVWMNIMDMSAMRAPAYELLVDLSAGFMLVAELSLLPTMQGYAEQDLEAGRCGLFQEAAMVVWAGSYFMGLASSLPEGTFPELQCP